MLYDVDGGVFYIHCSLTMKSMLYIFEIQTLCIRQTFLSYSGRLS